MGDGCSLQAKTNGLQSMLYALATPALAAAHDQPSGLQCADAVNHLAQKTLWFSTARSNCQHVTVCVWLVAATP